MEKNIKLSNVASPIFETGEGRLSIFGWISISLVQQLERNLLTSRVKFGSDFGTVSFKLVMFFRFSDCPDPSFDFNL